MLTAPQILHVLDHSNDGYYCSFVALGHPYSYLIDTRLNLFKAEEQWAIVVERLGYNPRVGQIELQLFYYGNCLLNLEEYNGRPVNSYTATPIAWEDFQAATTDDLVSPQATSLVVRGVPVKLTHDKAAYSQAGIELTEYEPDTITWEEAGRLLVREHAELFRATDQELYKSLPAKLQKILVLDHWFHKDFEEAITIEPTDSVVSKLYQHNQQRLAQAGISATDLAALMQTQHAQLTQQNQQIWDGNRPSSYETWQQLAEVLATGDVQYYQPTLAPNTHWRNWPESGSL